MAHTHGHDTPVIDRDGSGLTPGLLIGIATILLVALIGLVVLLAQPWDDNGGTVQDRGPGITDNTGGTGGMGGAPDGGTGTDGGGNTDGGAGSGGGQ